MSVSGSESRGWARSTAMLHIVWTSSPGAAVHGAKFIPGKYKQKEIERQHCVSQDIRGAYNGDRERAKKGREDLTIMHPCGY